MNPTDAPVRDPRDVRLTLSLAWAFLLFNYIYADIGFFARILMDPALVERFQTVGARYLTREFMLAAAALMEISIAMVFLSWKLPDKANRRANIAAGGLFTLVILFTLFGARKVPPLDFYTLFQVIETATSAAIMWYAWRWKTADGGGER